MTALICGPPLVVLQPEQTIGNALEFIRGHADAASIHYFYVVENQNQLVGVVPARRPLAAQPDKTVRDIMVRDVVAIPEWATVLIASEYFASRRLLAFPVVNDAGELKGVVDVGLFTDDVIDLAGRRQAGESIDPATYQARLAEAVVDVVRKQQQAGISIPGDGEFGKEMGQRVNYGAWWSYCFNRLGGLELATGVGLYELPPKRGRDCEWFDRLAR